MVFYILNLYKTFVLVNVYTGKTENYENADENMKRKERSEEKES